MLIEMCLVLSLWLREVEEHSNWERESADRRFLISRTFAVESNSHCW